MKKKDHVLDALSYIDWYKRKSDYFNSEEDYKKWFQGVFEGTYMAQKDIGYRTNFDNSILTEKTRRELMDGFTKLRSSKDSGMNATWASLDEDVTPRRSKVSKQPKLPDTSVQDRYEDDERAGMFE